MFASFLHFFSVPMEKVGLDRLVAVCLEAGRKACGLIRTIHSSGDLQCVEKGDGRDTLTGRPMRDIQTEADRQSEWIIFATLRHHFPNLKVCICGLHVWVRFFSFVDCGRGRIVGVPDSSRR